MECIRNRRVVLVQRPPLGYDGYNLRLLLPVASYTSAPSNTNHRRILRECRRDRIPRLLIAIDWPCEVEFSLLIVVPPRIVLVLDTRYRHKFVPTCLVLDRWDKEDLVVFAIPCGVFSRERGSCPCLHNPHT